MKLELLMMDGTVEYIEHNFIRNIGSEERIELVGGNISYKYSELISAELDGEVIYKWDCFQIEDKVNAIYDNLAALSEKISNADVTKKEYYLKEIIKHFRKKTIENKYPEELLLLFLTMSPTEPRSILELLNYAIYQFSKGGKDGCARTDK